MPWLINLRSKVEIKRWYRNLDGLYNWPLSWQMTRMNFDSRKNDARFQFIFCLTIEERWLIPLTSNSRDQLSTVITDPQSNESPLIITNKKFCSAISVHRQWWKSGYSKFREVLYKRCEPPEKCSTPTYSSNWLNYKHFKSRGKIVYINTSGVTRAIFYFCFLSQYIA